VADLGIRLGLNPPTMQHGSVSRRTVGKSLTGLFFACAGLFGVATVAATPTVRADAVAYLVNVWCGPLPLPQRRRSAELRKTASATRCLARTYAQVIADVKADVATSDEYQASI
jgi:hypothetical protein